MNNDGSVIRGSKVWRQIVGVRDWIPVKPLDRAIEEAREQFEDADEYALTSWSWGYTEEAGNFEQNEMRIAYWLYFDPIEDESGMLSRVVTILGQVEDL
jgi:hypothetical protein